MIVLVFQSLISDTFLFVYLEVGTMWYLMLLLFIQALLCRQTILPTFWHESVIFLKCVSSLSHICSLKLWTPIFNFMLPELWVWSKVVLAGNPMALSPGLSLYHYGKPDGTPHYPTGLLNTVYFTYASWPIQE